MFSSREGRESREYDGMILCRYHVPGMVVSTGIFHPKIALQSSIRTTDRDMNLKEFGIQFGSRSVCAPRARGLQKNKKTSKIHPTRSNPWSVGVLVKRSSRRWHSDAAVPAQHHDNGARFNKSSESDSL